MSETFLNGRVDLHHGDSREVLKTLPDNSIDSVVTDPPYALVSIVKRFGADGAAPTRDGDVYSRASAGFMGKQWDTGETAFDPEFWREVLRVLKPGGHILAFSGTRTYHRLACAIEDAGFEIRDMVDWLYGSGFPKSHAPLHGMYGLPRWLTRAQWRDFHRTARVMSGSALKPAKEPICLARKPLCGTIATNVCFFGTGALNIDGCRIAVDDDAYARNCSGRRGHSDNRGREMDFHLAAGSGSDIGRWPANVIHDGSDEVAAQFPEAKAGSPVKGTEPSSVTAGIYGEFSGRVVYAGMGDSGSAARFFYSAKADKMDRVGSKHPTVKPVDLKQYLCRLITPPGGVVLDPFAGTGTTGEAAWREGFRAILIEREAEYIEDIRRRMALCLAGPATRKAASKPQAQPDSIGGLFA